MLYARPELYVEFTLEPHSLAKGEWWRLLTFLFLPWSVGRGGLNAFFALFALQMLYMVGSSLEAQWGSFRFDVFYLLAALFTIASNFTDPDAYFVGGGVVETAPHVRDWFLSTVKEHTSLRPEQARVATFALVPDLDMAGARGSAIAALDTVRATLDDVTIA